MTSLEQGPATAESRHQRWWLVVLIALLLLGGGFALGFSFADSDVGQSPAIDMAREVGLALPIEQQPAFADGLITRLEVEDAIERLSACAEERGVTGFVAGLADEGTGFHIEHSGTNGMAVELCRLKHFEATYAVWSQQERKDD